MHSQKLLFVLGEPFVSQTLVAGIVCGAIAADTPSIWNRPCPTAESFLAMGSRPIF